MDILTYKKFIESININNLFQSIDIMESLNIWHDNLISSIGGKEVDIFETLSLPKDKFQENLDITYLSNNIEFFNSISSLGLKKSPPQSTDDFETFINKPCKFMMLYDFNASELENPEYIIFQTWNESLKKWSDAKLFKISNDIKNFYDKLSSKTIEITDGDKNYIYLTSNGNDWELQNLDTANNDFPRFLTKEDLQKIVDTKSVKLSII